jgi:ubiquinone biosynthesis protein
MLTIQRVLVRHGLDEVVWRTHLLRPIAWINRLVRRRPTQPLGVRIRLALEELGPIFVKFGQALSVRPDLLSPEVGEELAKLQDRRSPASSPSRRSSARSASPWARCSRSSIARRSRLHRSRRFTRRNCTTARPWW